MATRTIQVPSLSLRAVVGARLLSASEARQERKVATHARTPIQSIRRIIYILAGFSCLTWAGFTFNITAGLVTAAFSLFAVAYLDQPEPSDTTADETNRGQMT
jgi:hypothetical protein